MIISETKIQQLIDWGFKPVSKNVYTRKVEGYEKLLSDSTVCGLYVSVNSSESVDIMDEDGELTLTQNIEMIPELIHHYNN